MQYQDAMMAIKDKRKKVENRKNFYNSMSGKNNKKNARQSSLVQMSNQEGIQEFSNRGKKTR